MSKRVLFIDDEHEYIKKIRREAAHQIVLEKKFFRGEDGIDFCECGDYFYSYIDQNKKTKQCRKCREGFCDDVF